MNVAADAPIREQYKREAAERAVEFVLPGMIIGLGTGTTALFAIRRIARLLHE
jgi:ribose 5-phosphate isomerase A